jgi:exodeoxyribonuclease V alpha subunit
LHQNRLVTHDYCELDEGSLAYAITSHKAQGSEFPAVAIPVAMQHFILRERILIYTGITRAGMLLVVVGQKKALDLAVETTGHANDTPGSSAASGVCPVPNKLSANG